MQRSGVRILIVLVVMALAPTASAYQVDVEAPTAPIQVDAPTDVQVTVTVSCPEIASYGDPSAETVRFAVETILAQGLTTDAPELLDIDRQPCRINPQGETEGTLTIPVTATFQTPALVALANTVEVTPADNSGTFGPTETVPEPQPAESFDITVEYIAEIEVEVGVPLVKSSGAWFYLYMECTCNAVTHVEFKPVDDTTGAGTPAPVVFEDLTPGQNFGDGLVYLPRSVLNKADEWVYEAIPYADGNPSATGEKLTVTLTLESDIDEDQKTPAPGGALLLFAVGVLAARHRR